MHRRASNKDGKIDKDYRRGRGRAAARRKRGENAFRAITPDRYQRFTEAHLKNGISAYAGRG